MSSEALLPSSTPATATTIAAKKQSLLRFSAKLLSSMGMFEYVKMGAAMPACRTLFPVG
ncbi:MAG: hypothetical protein WBK19_03170 [Azonexus sp.]